MNHNKIHVYWQHAEEGVKKELKLMINAAFVIRQMNSVGC